jgi:predicted membrane protein (TIGR00267 family)
MTDGGTRPSLAARLRARYRLLRQYHQIAEVGDIARRYFSMNGFDGVLTTFGVLVGAFLGGVDDARAIILLVTTTAVSMGVSGSYGSYMVERAERGRELRELEESTLSDLRGTTIGQASRYASGAIAAVNGGTPFLSSLVVVTPFFFTAFWSVETAYYLAGAVAFVELFFFGVYLGHVSRENVWRWGIRLVAGGAIALALSLALGGGIT